MYYIQSLFHFRWEMWQTVPHRTIQWFSVSDQSLLIGGKIFRFTIRENTTEHHIFISMCFNDMYVYGLLIKYVPVLLCFLGKYLFSKQNWDHYFWR